MPMKSEPTGVVVVVFRLSILVEDSSGEVTATALSTAIVTLLWRFIREDSSLSYSFRIDGLDFSWQFSGLI